MTLSTLASTGPRTWNRPAWRCGKARAWPPRSGAGGRDADAASDGGGLGKEPRSETTTSVGGPPGLDPAGTEEEVPVLMLLRTVLGRSVEGQDGRDPSPRVAAVRGCGWV